jgi:putative oxidoreductase
VALLLGVGTRFAAAALWVLTVVAIYAVHWPSEWSSLAELWQGYAITNDGFGNYKLPLIYLVMLLPLMLGGGGRFSLDSLLAHLTARRHTPAAAASDGKTWGLVLFAIGATVSLLLPWAGGALAIAGIALMTWPRRNRGTAALLAST